MRRFRTLAIALTAILAVVAVAYAEQVNTYTVSGSISPTKAGTTKPRSPSPSSSATRSASSPTSAPR